MKNFPVTHEGKEYWISRAMTVVGILRAYNKEGQPYVLAVQRGKGTPDPEYVGSWCLPCGYLDYDETLQEAIARECKEETGLDTTYYKWRLASYNDRPEGDKRQNVGFRFTYDCFEPIENLTVKLTSRFSEKDEVSDIKFIPLSEIEDYKWAFNHDTIIEDLYNNPTIV